jgi:hypothetical protein
MSKIKLMFKYKIIKSFKKVKKKKKNSTKLKKTKLIILLNKYMKKNNFSLSSK